MAPAITRPLKQALLITLFTLGYNAFSAAQDFDWAPDFPVGSSITVLDAPDQNGENQTFESLKGEKGLLLMFNRSFDWCPFCKSQLAGLVEVYDQFESMGINIATITYDSADTLKLIEEDLGVPFSMLQDIDVKHVNAYNILNTDYQPGHMAYGVPQPGVMLIDADGVIQKKLAEENFRVRPDWSDVIAVAKEM